MAITFSYTLTHITKKKKKRTTKIGMAFQFVIVHIIRE